MKIDPNAPAYPSQHDSDYRGLSIRAELAARAMEGVIASYVDDPLQTRNAWQERDPSEVAEYAVAFADALIAALNETEAGDE